MAVNLATLRSQIELALAGRVTAPFTFRDRRFVESVSTGISELDALVGGLPRGGLTEIFGPYCAGRTSLLFSALGARTAQAEACALIDGCDAFDPHSAEAAGVDLKQLLWVRCRNIEQSLRSTDLLLQGGGFGFIALDLSDIPRETVRHVPLDAWFRFRRAVEDTPTILAVFEQESNAKTCASLVLRLDAEAPRWSATPAARPPVACLPGKDGQACLPNTQAVHAANFSRQPFAWLLDGFQIRAELVHSRRQQVLRTAFQEQRGLLSACGEPVIFATQEIWSDHPQPASPAGGRQASQNKNEPPLKPR